MWKLTPFSTRGGRRYLLLLLVCGRLPLLSHAQRPGTATLRGQVRTLAAGDSLRLTYLTSQGFQTQATAAGPHGGFVVRAPGLARPGYASLVYQQQFASVYLTPGDELTLGPAALPSPGLRFSGRGAAANNYLAQAGYAFEQGPAGTPPVRRLRPRRAPRSSGSRPTAFAARAASFSPPTPRPTPCPPLFAKTPPIISTCSGR